MRLFRTMGSFGERAAQASSKVRVLDDSLAATGTTATKTATSVDRAARATNLSGTAATKAATAQDRHATALRRVDATMGLLAGSTEREQAAVLRALAAQERYDQLLAAGTADTRALASAQATLVSAQRSVAAAQAAATKETAALATAQTDAAVSGGAFRASMAGTLGMARDLGVLFGVIEGVRKALDISHEATTFQAAMTRIQTQAGATADEVTRASDALLKMAPRVAQTPEALATSLYHVYSATKALGYTLPQMLRAVEIAARGATVSGADLEETTNSLTATMVSGLGSVNDMSKAMGALNAIIGAGDMKQQDLNDALSTGILIVAKTFGVDIAQAGAALDVFGDNNIRGAHAATMLRMSIQDLAKPAAHADDVLSKIGLTSADLRKALAQGGLSGALQLLAKRMEIAGITGNKVGGFIADAFTKKAGAGLAILLNNLDQYLQKQATINKASGNFGSAWSAATKTARFALDSLSARIKAGGIVIAEKLNPYIADAANFLGTSIPHALGVLANYLGPTIHLVGAGLGGAWHVVAAVLMTVGSALGSVGHFLQSHEALTKTVATTVLTMWAAWKSYTIAMTAITAVRLALSRFAASSIYTLAAVGARGRQLGTVLSTGLSPAATALTALGLIIGAAVLHSNDHAAALEREKEEVQQLTDAINQDSGALGKHTRAVVEDALEAAGAFTAARNLHISLSDVTDAALGNHAAMGRVNDALGKYGQFVKIANGLSGRDVKYMKESGSATDRKVISIRTLTEALGGSNAAVKDAVQNARNHADANKSSAKASQDSALATSGLSRAVQIGTEADKAAAAAAKVRAAEIKKLDDALQNLAQTELAQVQSEDALREGLLDLPKTLRSNKDALNTTTKAGLANRDALAQMFGQAVGLAQAQRKNGDSIGYVTATLIDNVRQIRETAAAAGLSKPKIDALVRALKLTPHDIRTTFHIDTSAAARNVRNLASMLAALHDKTITVTEYNANRLAAKGYAAASGGTVPGAPSRVDSVPAMLAPGEEVITAFQAAKHRPLLKAINAGTQGFAAGGTVGRPVTRAYASATRPYAMQTAVSVADISRALNGCRLVLDLPGVGKMNAHIDSRASSIARAEIDGDHTHRTTLDGMRG